MRNRRRKGNALIVKKHRFGDDHVIQMSHTTMIGIVGDEDIALTQSVAIAINDDLHGFIQYADKSRNPCTGTDKPTVCIGHACADIKYFVDDRTHGGFA